MVKILNLFQYRKFNSITFLKYFCLVMCFFIAMYVISFRYKCIGRLKNLEISDVQNANNKYYVSALEDKFFVGSSGKVAILIIDSNSENLKKIFSILSAEDYNVVISNNTLQAIDFLNPPLSYDLCIVNYKMFDEEMCRQIRDWYSCDDLPMLMLIDKSNIEDMVKAVDVGINDFLDTSFEDEELRSRVKTLVSLKRTTEKLLLRETEYLNAQIKSHFIFNTLNTISSFCYSDADKARELLVQLSIVLRDKFEFKSDSKFVTIDKEIKLVQAYVTIQKSRFEDRLLVVYNIDSECLKYNIPSFVLQPLVENSIKHGILKRPRGGKVILSIKQIKDSIYIQIEDNGIGIKKDRLKEINNNDIKSKSVGIKNINLRLKKFYGVSLDIHSEENQYTIVRFIIPAEKGSENPSYIVNE